MHLDTCFFATRYTKIRREASDNRKETSEVCLCILETCKSHMYLKYQICDGGEQNLFIYHNYMVVQLDTVYLKKITPKFKSYVFRDT